MNIGMKPMSFPSSYKSCDGASDLFPAGLRVLVVDDDPTCLRILERMLMICLYEVTKCNRAEIALKLLRDNKNGYDIVISDVHMPDMDGFKLLEYVGLEMDLPVIMMSADDGKNVVMKGVTHGACDYLIKPVRMEALKNIWQHVVRKKKHEWKENNFEQSGSLEVKQRHQKAPEDVDYSSSANDGNWKSSKRKKDEEDDSDERDDTSNVKRSRVVWSVELHQQFVTAVNRLGFDKAVPKRILELMNVPGLTRENVASHLQKYRLYLRRLSCIYPQHNGLGNSFIGHQDPTFGSISSLNAFDLQALAASGQLPPQSLPTIQVGATLGRTVTNSNVQPSLVDQRNIFSFENPNLRFLEAQQQQNNNNSNKQVNLLHSIPTNMDSKQLATLHQSAQYQSNTLLTQMVQPQVISSVVDFSRSQSTKLPGNSFSLVNNSEVNSEMKDSRGFVPNNDVFNGLTQNRTHNWGLQSVRPIFDGTEHSNILGPAVSSSVLVQPRFSFNQLTGQSRNPFVNSSPADNSLRIKAERQPGVGFQNGLYPEHFVQEDLMSALLKQQQGLGNVENDFGFDAHQLDNLPLL